MKTRRTNYWLLGAVLIVAAALLTPTAGARSLAAPVNTCAPTLSGQAAAGKDTHMEQGLLDKQPDDVLLPVASL